LSKVVFPEPRNPLKTVTGKGFMKVLLINDK
jgi:hypothetical protein